MISVLLAMALQSAYNQLPKSEAMPPPVDEQNVLLPIKAMFVAFRSGDSAALMRYAYPDGRVTANGDLPNHKGLSQQSFAEFAAHLTPSDGWEETISDPAIEIDGDIAMVWAPFVVRTGGKVINCGFDHFDLVRENGSWKVMNLTFSSRMTGCPRQ